MTWTGLEQLNDTSISGVMSYPTTGVPYFFAILILAVFVIIGFMLFKRDEEKLGKGDMLSSLGVSGIVCIVLSLISTLFKAMPRDVFIESTIFYLVFVGLWLWKD